MIEIHDGMTLYQWLSIKTNENYENKEVHSAAY